MKLYLAESTYNNRRWAQVVNTKEEAEKGFMEDMKDFALDFIEKVYRGIPLYAFSVDFAIS